MMDVMIVARLTASVGGPDPAAWFAAVSAVARAGRRLTSQGWRQATRLDAPPQAGSDTDEMMPEQNN